MLRKKRTLLKQKKRLLWSPRRKIMLKKVRFNILRRNNAYYLARSISLAEPPSS